MISLQRLTLLLILTSSLLINCTEKIVIPEPVYPGDEIIGPNGPEPMPHWEVVKHSGQIVGVDYYNTGGSWYISIEMKELLETKYTQLYLNPNAIMNGNKGWFMTKSFNVGNRFLYIPDPAKTYHAWDYVVFIYTDYVPGE